MLVAARSARCNHGDGHRLRDRADERDIITLQGAVAVDRGDQDLAGTTTLRLASQLHRSDPGGARTGVRAHLELTMVAAAHIDRHHYALGPEAIGDGADDLRIENGPGSHRHLVRPHPPEPLRLF